MSPKRLLLLVLFLIFGSIGAANLVFAEQHCGGGNKCDHDQKKEIVK